MNSRILVTAAAAASLLMSAAAFAASNQATGTIKAITESSHSILLSDGVTYTLPSDMKLGAFKVGDKVVVTWDMVGTEHEATAVVPAG